MHLRRRSRVCRDYVRLTACAAVSPHVQAAEVIDLSHEPPGSTAIVAVDDNAHQDPAPDGDHAHQDPAPDGAPDALAIVPAHTRATPYESVSRAELIAMLQSRDADIKRLDARVLRSQALARQTRKQHDKFVAKSTVARRSQDGLAVTRRGKRRLTNGAIISVAIRRNFSNISSQDCVVCGVESYVLSWVCQELGPDGPGRGLAGVGS